MSKTIKLSDFEYEQMLVILTDFSNSSSWNDTLAAKIGKTWVKKLLGKLTAAATASPEQTKPLGEKE